MNIKNWSTTASNNNATSPDGFPEGMAPSGVNDSARELMAALRAQHENAEWIDYGYTLSYISASSFVLDGDRTTQFHAGRRVKAGVGAGNVFGTILSASYSTKTGVTIILDSGSLDSSLSSMAVGVLAYVNTSMPQPRTASTAQAISDGNNTIRTKIISIGDWNMNADAAKTVTHSLTLSTIRTISGTIRNDAATSYYLIAPSGSTDPDVQITGTNAVRVLIARKEGGGFDSSDFSATASGGGSFTRGWLTITYVD